MEPSLASVAADMKDRVQAYRKDVGNSLPAVEKWVAEARTALATPKGEIPAAPQLPNNPMTDAGFPTTLYNGMIHPVAPYAIKGALGIRANPTAAKETSTTTRCGP